MDRVLVFGTSDGGSIPSRRTRMEKIFFNKLIRDKVSDKLNQKGIKFKVRELSEEEYEKELMKKVLEEAIELSTAENRDQLVSEFCDLQFTIDELKKIKNISDQELVEAKKDNFDQKGGFNQRLFLEWTDDNGYQRDKK